MKNNYSLLIKTKLFLAGFLIAFLLLMPSLVSAQSCPNGEILTESYAVSVTRIGGTGSVTNSPSIMGDLDNSSAYLANNFNIVLEYANEFIEGSIITFTGRNAIDANFFPITVEFGNSSSNFNSTKINTPNFPDASDPLDNITIIVPSGVGIATASGYKWIRLTGKPWDGQQTRLYLDAVKITTTKCNPCSAGAEAPIFATNPTTLITGKATFDLNTYDATISNRGTKDVKWYYFLPASTDSEISNGTQVLAGTYYAAFEGDDGGSTCYSNTTEFTIIGDFDADGIVDAVDIDDDNDGILDKLECPKSLTSSGSFEYDPTTDFDLTNSGWGVEQANDNSYYTVHLEKQFPHIAETGSYPDIIDGIGKKDDWLFHATVDWTQGQYIASSNQQANDYHPIIKQSSTDGGAFIIFSLSNESISNDLTGLTIGKNYTFTYEMGFLPRYSNEGDIKSYAPSTYTDITGGDILTSDNPDFSTYSMADFPSTVSKTSSPLDPNWTVYRVIFKATSTNVNIKLGTNSSDIVTIDAVEVNIIPDIPVCTRSLNTDSDGDGCDDGIEAGIDGGSGSVGANGLYDNLETFPDSGILNNAIDLTTNPYDANEQGENCTACTPSVPTVVVTAATCSSEATNILSTYDSSLTYTSTPAGLTVGADGVITGGTNQDYTITAGNTNCTSAASLSFTYDGNVMLVTPDAPTITVVAPTCASAGTATITNYVSGNTYTFDNAAVSHVGEEISGFTFGSSYTVTSGNTTSLVCTSDASASFTILDQLATPVAPTVVVTGETCASAATNILSTYDANLTYTSTPTGLSVGAGGVITGGTNQAYTITATNASTCAATTASFTYDGDAILASPTAPTVVVTAETCASAATNILSTYDANLTYTSTPTGLSVGAGGIITGGTNQAYTITATNASTCAATTASFTYDGDAILASPTAPTVVVTAETCASAATNILSTYDTSLTYTSTPTGLSVGAGGVITGGTNQAYTITATNASTCAATTASFTYDGDAILASPTAPTVVVTAETCASAATNILSTYDTSLTYTSTPTGLSVGAGGVITGGTNQAYTITATNASTCAATTASFTYDGDAILASPTAPTVVVTAETCASAATNVLSTYDSNLTYTSDPVGLSVGTGGVITNGTTGTSYTITAGNTNCTSEASLSFTYDGDAMLVSPSVPTVVVTGETCASAATNVLSTYDASLTYISDPVGLSVGTGGVITNGTTGTSYTITAGNTNCTSEASLSFTYDGDAMLVSPSVPTVVVTGETCASAATNVLSTYDASLTYISDPVGLSVGTGGVITNGTTGTSYTITAGNTNCTSEASLSFTYDGDAMLVSPSVPTVVVTEIVCGATTGTITVTVQNVSDTYSFDDGANYQSSNSKSGLVADTYQIKIKNTSGCESVATSKTIATAPAVPTAPVATITPIACGSTTGTITLTVQNASDTYSFDDGANYQSSNSKPGLSAGSYKVKIKNTSGCESVAISKTIAATPAVPTAAAATITPIACGSTTGTITLTVQNVSDTYSFDDGANYQSSNSKPGLSAGSYKVKIKNTSGCESVATSKTIAATPACITTASNDNFTGNEDAGDITGNVITGDNGNGVDNDTESDPLTVESATVDNRDGTATALTLGTPTEIKVSGIKIGTLTLKTNGDLVFIPELNYNGTVPTINYVVTDNANTDNADIVITVTPVDDTPIATDDTPSDVLEDSGKTNIAVITNDSFGGDGASTKDIVVTPINVAVGTAVLNNSGTPNNPTDDSIDFIPALDYNGAVSITYEIEDADGDKSTATVTFDVTSVDDTPIATNDTPSDVLEDSGKTNIAVITNDNFGGDGASTNPIVVTAIPASIGTAVLNNGGTPNNPTDDSIDFTPALDYNGAVSITYKIEDADGDKSTATVTFDVTSVDDAPIATDDTPSDVLEDSGKTNIAVITNDNFGGDGASTNPIVVTAIPASVGTAVLNNGGTPNNPTDDSIDFTPALDYNGAVSITYKIEDADGDKSTATVTFDVTSVDDTPIATDDTPSDVLEDSGKTNIAVITNDSFGGDGASTNPIVVTPINVAVGTAVLNNSGTPNNPTDDSIDFIPALDYNGAVSITYEIEDADGDKSTATVTFDVTSVDDTPIATNDTPSDVLEDSGKTNIAVITNDSFGGDGASTNPIVVTAIPASIGTAVLNNGGTPNNPTDDSIDFTPALDYNGAVSITYKIEDADGDKSTATVTFDVTSVDDTPIATNDTPSDVLEDSGKTNIAVITNDSFGGDGASTNPIVVTAIPASIGTAVLNNGGTPNNPTDDSIDFTPALDYNGAVSITYKIEDADGDKSTATVTFDVTSVDDAPIATDDTPSDVLEDSGKTNIAVITNDSFGGDGASTNPIVVTAIPASVGTAVLNNGGTPNNPTDDSIDFTPALDYNGAVSITYKIEDADGDKSTATITFDVTPVDDTPIATDDTPSDVLEDSGKTNIAVITNDNFGGDGASTNPIVVTAIPASVGTAVLNNGGTPNDPTDDSIDFTPALNYNGAVSITYEIEDADGDKSTATVTFDVTSVDDAPIATDDTPSDVLEDSGKTNIAVITNDSFGGDGASTKDIVVTAIPASVGTAVLNNGGTPNNPTDDSIDFTPALDYNGAVSITYEIEDADGDKSTATVTFDVTSVDDTPIATDDTPSDVLEDSGKTNIAVITNDSFGGDGASTNPIVVTAIPASVGTAVLNNSGTPNNPTDDSIDFIPALDYNGAVSITYEIEDADGDKSTATVTFDVTSVDDTPIATDDTPSDVLEDSGKTNIAVITNDSFGGDGASTKDIVVTAIPASVGTAILNNGGTPNDPTDDSIDFTPALDYNGAVSITYEIEDADGDKSTATVTFNVTSVNDTPIILADVASINEDETLNGTDLRLNDSDIDGDDLVINTIPVTDVANGTLTINADGTYKYVPNANFNGTDSFVYEVCDDATPALCAQAIVIITVNPVNDETVIANDSASTNENVAVTIDVLANDTDVDGNNATLTSVTNGTNGTTSIVNGKIVYTPNENFNGEDTFAYTNSEGNTATVTITVNPVNDSPVAVNDTATVVENGTLNGTNLRNNDSDIDGDDLVINTIPVTDVANGTLTINADGTYKYVPNANFNGTDSFVYEVCDDATPALCAQATVIITVNPVNDETVIANDSASTNENVAVTIDVLANDTDVDGNNATLTSVTNGTNGTTSIVNGKIVYTPNENFNGEDTFAYTNSEGNTATVTITVNPVNDSPVAVNDTATVVENGTLNGTNLRDNDSDIDGDDLVINTIPVTDVANGTLTINADGTYKYIPNANFHGTDSFVYEVCDDATPALCAQATVTITVNPVNDSPVAVNDTATVVENGTLNGTNLQDNDSDIDGDDLVINTIPVTDVANGTLTINADGTYRYVPNTNFNGTDSFVYEVCDNGTPQQCAQATVTITVNPINDLFIPEVITPNADGYNDIFVIKGLGKYPNNSLVIFNRWGNAVYKMQAYDNRWDGFGNVNGQFSKRRLPPATYFYILNLGENNRKITGYVYMKY